MSDFINKFPYSDLHELNLDWIIKTIKDLDGRMTEFEAINAIKYEGIWDITKQYEPWTVVNNNNYAYMSKKAVPVGIDITDQDYWLYVSMFSIDMELSNTSINPVANKVIKAKLDDIESDINTVESGMTIALREESEARAAADTALQTALDQESSTRAAADTSLSDRISALIEPATVDSEVIDIRTDVEGVTYTTAGDAVRALEKKVNSIQSYEFIESSYVHSDGRIISGAGVAPRCRTNYLLCGGGVQVTYAGESHHAGVSGISFWDSKKVFISSYSNNATDGTPVTVTSPVNAVYAIISLKTALKPKFVYSVATGGVIHPIAQDLYDKINRDAAYLDIETNGTNRSVNYTAINGLNYIYTNDPDYEIMLQYNTDYHTQWARLINICDYVNPDYIQIRKADNSTMAAGTARRVVKGVRVDALTQLNAPMTICGYVDGTNGSDSNKGRGWADAVKTISRAVNMGYRRILIAPGTYAESVKALNIDTLELLADINDNFDYPTDVDNPLVIIDASGNNEGIDIRNAKNVRLQNIKVINAERFGIYLNRVEYVRADYCIADTCAAGGFKLQDVNGDFYNCNCHAIGTMGGGQHNDGFNMHGTGTTNFYNCSASYCEDDGISHHDACCGLIDGGEWQHCGKGGVASPTHGAVIDVKNIYAHDNAYGIYCDSSDEFTRRKVNFTNCACKNNSTKDIYITSDYSANVWNCIYDTISTGSHINVIG